MTATFIDVLIYSLIGSLLSLIGGIILLSRNKSSKWLEAYATPFAAGALLAAVFIDLLPEGIEESDTRIVLIAVLAGIIIFFYLERFLRWFHHHSHQNHSRDNTSASLIIIGDTVHNILDGVVIASAFLINVPTGIVATLAVAAHEIPQEVGDFGLLLNRGMSKSRILIINILSSLASVVAALIIFSIGKSDALTIGVLIGLSAGFLLYIATSDIIPGIHEETDHKKITDIRPLLLLVGVILVSLIIILAERFVVA
jgi:zinc and cadmium transporter